MESLDLFGLIHQYGAVGYTASVIVFIALGYLGVPFILWAIAILAVLFGLAVPMTAIYIVAAVLAIFVIKPLRQMLVSKPLMGLMKNFIPSISDTERTALEAGVVWAEQELFSGKPNFKKLINEPYPELTDEEKNFIDNTTDELCEAIDEWKVWKERGLSDEVMKMIKDKGFLGMIIPKEHGGLNFSASAHGEVIAKLSSRSLAAGITVMVPNSLGPAELLNHYGTEDQKKKYLPRLASGDEVPCFGLTEPTAGSDAGSITSYGVLFKGDDGRLKIKLQWNKRWITLAAISTIIGLAFRLRDPENLLGQGEDLGITCALIPSNTPGVVIGRRHDPLGVPFYNCPTQGHDVVVDAEEAIIGGVKNAGNGWTMLMESLGAGRGISLPSQSVGGLKLVTRVTSAHASVRKQFGLPIGKFEGVEEPLARIVGANYYIDAMRQYTFGALNRGIAPPVITAMCKYYSTEAYRKAVNDGMDIVGGAGISMGPRNVIAQGYIAAPIGITVEGANILTRTLIIFGQGALRAHPYAFKEVDAIGKKDAKAFDDAFWGHIGHITRNKMRSLVLSVTRARFALTPVGGPLKRYYQKLAWASASFAIMSDMAMGLLGGKLKVKEKITGRFADILAWMYIGTSVLRRWEAEGRRKEDLPLVHYSMQEVFKNIQQGFDGIFSNFDVPVLGWFFKYPIKFWSRLNRIDSDLSDKLSHKVADMILNDQDIRERLTHGIYLPLDNKEEALGRLENAYKLAKQTEGLVKKVKKAQRAKKLEKAPILKVLDEAVKQNVLTQQEADLVKEAETAILDTIQVDDFSEEQYVANKVI